MSDIVVTSPSVEEPAVSGASWGSILVGAVASLAITFVVLAFGTGLGLSVVSPWETAGVSATTFKMATGIYLIVVAMFSSSIGGYLAGRLRTRWIGVHSDEVYFRDTAHGFAAWAVATVVGLGLLAGPSSHLIGGAVSGATQAASSNGAPVVDRYVDQLLRADTSGGQNNVPNNSVSDTRAELGRIFTPTLQNGDAMGSDDKAYVARIVSQRTGLSQPEAEKRVNDVVARAKADVDAARKAAAHLAFWLTASLIIGAFCASLAATEGGSLRDGRWRNKRVA